MTEVHTRRPRRVLVGSSADVADVLIAGPDIAPVHCSLEHIDEDIFAVRDLGAPSGVFVRARRLAPGTTALVRIAEQIRLGESGSVSIKPNLARRLGYHSSATIEDPRAGAEHRAPMGSGAAPTTVAIRVNNLSVRTKRNQTTLLRDVDLAFAAGNLVGVLGPSGSGKTTLLGALRRPDAYPQVRLQTGQAKARVAYLPQDDLLLSDLTVRECVLLAGRLHLGAQEPLNEIESRADRIIEELGLSRVAESRVGDAERRGVSGGERRRVSIACELMSEPEILLLDEPTTGLSSADAFDLMGLLRKLADNGRLVMLSIHQPSRATYELMTHAVYAMNGHVVYAGAAAGALGYFRTKTGPRGSDREDDPASTVLRILHDFGISQGPEVAEKLARQWKDSEQRSAEQAGSSNQEVRPTRQRAKIDAAASQPVMWWLNALTTLRDRHSLLTQFIGTTAFSLVVAYANMPDGNDLFSRFGHVPPALVQLVLVVFLFASFGSSNAIVSQRAWLHHMQRSGLRVSSFVMSRALVQLILAGIQALLAVSCLCFLLPLEASPIVMWCALWLVAFSGSCAGLAASALGKTPLQAILLVVSISALQLTVGGVARPLPELPSVMRTASLGTVTRWGNEALLSAEYGQLSGEDLVLACAADSLRVAPEDIAPKNVRCSVAQVGDAWISTLVSREVGEWKRLSMNASTHRETCAVVCSRILEGQATTPMGRYLGTDADRDSDVVLEQVPPESYREERRGGSASDLRLASRPWVAILLDFFILILQALSFLLFAAWRLRATGSANGTEIYSTQGDSVAPNA